MYKVVELKGFNNNSTEFLPSFKLSPIVQEFESIGLFLDFNRDLFRLAGL